jgi:deoxyadenosine/deoxycytidine kinase
MIFMALPDQPAISRSAMSYLRRVYDNDFTACCENMLADDMCAAYILARAMTYDSDTNLVKVTDAVRNRLIHMLRKLDFDLLSTPATKPLVISIDGNIAASKSTVLDAVRKAGLPVGIVPEPVDKWTPLLSLYYEDTARWTTALHTDVLVTYTALMRQQRPDSPVVCERSAWSCVNVFQDMLFRDGVVRPEEHAVIMRLWELVASAPDVVLYLRCSPEECIKRKISRGRACEKDLDHSYMYRLHDQYEKVMSDSVCAQNGTRLIIIDAARPVEQVSAEVVDVVKRLLYVA